MTALLQQHSCPQKEHIDAQDSIFKRGKPYKEERNKGDRLCAGEEKDRCWGNTPCWACTTLLQTILKASILRIKLKA